MLKVGNLLLFFPLFLHFFIDEKKKQRDPTESLNRNYDDKSFSFILYCLYQWNREIEKKNNTERKREVKAAELWLVKMEIVGAAATKANFYFISKYFSGIENERDNVMCKNVIDKWKWMQMLGFIVILSEEESNLGNGVRVLTLDIKL